MTRKKVHTEEGTAIKGEVLVGEARKYPNHESL
jgi:hypothetical protein